MKTSRRSTAHNHRAQRYPVWCRSYLLGCERHSATGRIGTELSGCRRGTWLSTDAARGTAKKHRRSRNQHWSEPLRDLSAIRPGQVRHPELASFQNKKVSNVPTWLTSFEDGDNFFP